MQLKLLVNSFDRKYWEECSTIFDDYSIYRTWPYQQIRATKSLTKLKRFILLNNKNRPVIMGQIRVKSFFKFVVGYIQRGPLILNNQVEMTNYDEIINYLKRNLILRLKLNVLRIN